MVVTNTVHLQQIAYGRYYPKDITTTVMDSMDEDNENRIYILTRDSWRAFDVKNVKSKVALIIYEVDAVLNEKCIELTPKEKKDEKDDANKDKDVVTYKIEYLNTCLKHFDRVIGLTGTIDESVTKHFKNHER